MSPPAARTPERLRAFASLLKQNERSFDCEVRGRSMGAALADGSHIQVLSGASRGFVPGQVVAFLCGDAVIAHRVVHAGRRGRARGHILTRGDACLLPDPPMPVEAVLGPVLTMNAGGPGLPPAQAREGRLRRLARGIPSGAVAALMVIHVGLAQRVAKGFIAAGRLARGERA